MDEREVVTCFLRNEGRALLARRSDDADSYPGQWGAITGYLTPDRGAPPDDPETAARREICEETGLEDVALVRQGDPFAVEDADRGARWRVHPFLFETTPADRWAGLCTDEGMLDADEISDIAVRHRSSQQW